MVHCFIIASNPPSIEGVLIALFIFIACPIIALSLLIASFMAISQKQRKSAIICVVLALVFVMFPILLALY